MFIATAPTRIDLAGGTLTFIRSSCSWTTLTVNASVDLRSRAEVRPGQLSARLVSEDQVCRSRPLSR